VRWVFVSVWGEGHWDAAGSVRKIRVGAEVLK